jgi:hypothetical protein
VLTSDFSYQGADGLTKTGREDAGTITLHPGAKGHYYAGFADASAGGQLFASINTASGRDFSVGVKVG